MNTTPKTKPNNKPKTNIQKNNGVNHRAGDWVCLLCSNHNYSFREVCNRCNSQTKMSNLRQSLAFYQDQNVAPTISPPFSFDSYPCEDGFASKKFGSDGSLQTLDLENSNPRLARKPFENLNHSFGNLNLLSETKESEKREFAFEKQLCFSSSSSEDEADEQEEDGDLPNVYIAEQEKRILNFLNFD